MSDPSPARSTLQDRVYLDLSADITSGALAPGDKLRVAHLAKRFGTSQAPVREALRRLTEEGLANTIPYVGAVVSSPTWEQIQEIYALRGELEAYAVRLTLARYPTPQLAPVRRALRDLARAVKTDDELHVIDADLAFHRSICTLAGSPLTLELWETLVQRFRGARLSLMREHRDDFSTMVTSHELLLAALEGGDSVRAESEIRAHLRSAVEAWADRTGNSLEGVPR